MIGFAYISEDNGLTWIPFNGTGLQLVAAEEDQPAPAGERYSVRRSPDPKDVPPLPAEPTGKSVSEE